MRRRCPSSTLLLYRGSLEVGDLLSDMAAHPMEASLGGRSGWVHEVGLCGGKGFLLQGRVLGCAEWGGGGDRALAARDFRADDIRCGTWSQEHASSAVLAWRAADAVCLRAGRRSSATPRPEDLAT